MGRTLRDPSVTEFRVVTTPQKAMRRRFPVNMVCINRCWLRPLGEKPVGGLAENVAGWYESVSASHRVAIEGVEAEFSGRVGRICVLDELARDVDGALALRALERQLVGQ